MGCDIHPFLEVKIDGRWVVVSHVYAHRSYLAFSILSGVRSNSYKGNKLKQNICGAPVDMPADVSVEIHSEHTSWGYDAHSLTVIKLKQARKLYDEFERMSVDHSFDENFVELLESCMEFAEDARIIAWYDN